LRGRGAKISILKKAQGEVEKILRGSHHRIREMGGSNSPSFPRERKEKNPRRKEEKQKKKVELKKPKTTLSKI